MRRITNIERERAFNAIYRQWRLTAQDVGRPFPNYADARRHFDAMRSDGNPADWDRVFAPWTIRAPSLNP